MFLRAAIAISLVLFLAGCVTTSTTSKNQTQQVNSQIKELQDKVYFLEQELQARGKEISELEMELDNIKRTEIYSRQKTQTAPTANLSVRQMQTALKNAGFYRGAIDGKLGKQTKNAITKFQKAHGLKADGIIGKRTTEELSKYLN